MGEIMKKGTGSQLLIMFLGIAIFSSTLGGEFIDFILRSIGLYAALQSAIFLLLLNR